MALHSTLMKQNSHLAKIQYSPYPNFFRIFFYYPVVFFIPKFCHPEPRHTILRHIGFNKHKFNMFLDDISWYHYSKMGSLSIETKLIGCAHSKKEHMKFTHISNKTITIKINSISQINKTRRGCMEKGKSIWSYFYNPKY